MIPIDENTVTISMPTYACPRTTRKAVETVLAQTHNNLRLIVINDGENPEMTWKPIADINDPRLTRFDLPTNHGRYYADAVTLKACQTKWLAIHDADDWSEPEWLAELVDRANQTGALATFSPQHLHTGNRHKIVPTHPYAENQTPIPQLSEIAHHAGLYDVALLKSIGGHHPGFRVGYDTLLVNLIRLSTPIAVTSTPRYHRITRIGSLTTSAQTGFGSPARNEVKRLLIGLYYRVLNRGDKTIKEIIETTIPTELAQNVISDAERLRNQL